MHGRNETMRQSSIVKNFLSIWCFCYSFGFSVRYGPGGIAGLPRFIPFEADTKPDIFFHEARRSSIPDMFSSSLLAET